MIAKVSWNIAKTVSGMLPFSVSTSMPDRKDLESPPHQALAPPPSPNAMLYATTTQARVTMQVIPKHCISTESTFFVRTSPA